MNINFLRTIFVFLFTLSISYADQELDQYVQKFNKYVISKSQKLLDVYDTKIEEAKQKSKSKTVAKIHAKKQQFQIALDPYVTPATAGDNYEIVIADPVLKKCIYKLLNKMENETLRFGEVKSIDKLDLRFDKSKSEMKITEINPLKYFVSLKDLNLDQNAIEDITPLSKLKQLGALHLASNNITDVSGLSELTSLQILDLNFNDISDITPLKKMINLKRLCLSSNNISDCSIVADMTKLNYLKLSSNKLSALPRSISKLTHLRRLDISSNRINEIQPLHELTNLTALSIDYNPIEDLSAINNLTKLSYLMMGGSPVVDLSLVKGCKNLETILIYGSPLKNTKDMNIYFPRLKKLHLPNCQLTDISFLSKLSYITSLGLSSNKISSFKPIQDFNNLQSLLIDNTGTEDLSILSKLLENGCFSKPPFWTYSVKIQNNNVILTQGSENRKVLDKILKITDKVAWKKGNKL